MKCKFFALVMGAFLLSGGIPNAAEVKSKTGVTVKVAPEFRQSAQCLVDKVDLSGTRITAMRGYGPGTVRGSLHPSGRALDINQFARNVAKLPRAAHEWGKACGLVSGASWRNPDFGHFEQSRDKSRGIRRVPSNRLGPFVVSPGAGEVMW